MNRTLFFILFLSLANLIFSQGVTRSYDFEGEISEEVLRNYLSRAVTMAEFSVKPEFSQDGYNQYSEDDFRFIENISPKFIGRAIFRWGNESRLNDPEFINYAKESIDRIHERNPDAIFQASIFEVVTTDLNAITIPDYVFQAFDVEVENRKFNYSDMLDESGKFVNHWGTDRSVPDITRLETQFWFYYLAALYIDAGFEAIHWGQVRLIGMNDQARFSRFDKVFKMVREYAFSHARRKYVLFDAHTPNGGIIANRVLLFDFHSFPLRIKEVVDKPMEGILEVGHLDALYTRSRGGMTASGWECESLPYLVEFDNFGISDHSGSANINDHFVWGYDEISWFANQADEYGKEFLEYAYNWISEADTNGYLQMPGGRKVSELGYNTLYRANTKSENCLIGRNLEETIMDLWTEEGTVDISNTTLPEKFILNQNYPNPFNPTTTISYSLPQSGFVQLKVYDMLGCEVATLVNEEQSQGNYSVEFDASSVNRRVTSGIYFYKIQVRDFTQTKKLILLR